MTDSAGDTQALARRSPTGVALATAATLGLYAIFGVRRTS